MSGYVPDLSGRSVVWLDRGWQPVYIGFCPSKRAWVKEMRKMGLPGEAWPTSAGSTQTFYMKDKTCCIVTLAERAEAGHSRFGIAGLLAHEATHVWQKVREGMGEKDPSCEFEAYSVQAIFQNIYRAWWDTRGCRAELRQD